MGQKVHPLGFRLGITQEHKSNWFSHLKIYPIQIQQDLYLRNYLLETYPSAEIANIEIERKIHKIHFKIEAQYPRQILKQTELEQLKKDLEKKLYLYTIQKILIQKQYEFYKELFLEKVTEVSIFISEVKNPDINSQLLGNRLVFSLQRRIPFRKAIKQVIKEAEAQKVEGIKIQISGRLNGAEIARSEWVRKGRVPLQTLRANIDYTYTTAKTIYGLLGIKIWVFHGEKVE